MSAIPFCLPDDITAEVFLSEYWQKKPLLIKQGLPQLIGMFEPDDMLGLALDEDASARLLMQADAKTRQMPEWQLKKSPLTEADFDNLPTRWTVLIQNLEQWSPELASLWQAFGFIPQWQRDDIMVSYAPKGGSVGKHYDDYDVFLAQGYGSRRWQLGKVCDAQTEFAADEPIRVFDDMGEIIFDEVLEAGDVLYVPPKLSHFGVAEDDCLTFSFGCRRPNLMQIIDSLTDVATHDPALFVPMILPQTLQPSGELQPASIKAIKDKLIAMLESNQGDELMRQAVAEVVSRRQYDALMPEDTITTDELIAAMQDGARLRADFNSRIIYIKDDERAQNDQHIYVNGQRLDDLSDQATTLLIALANGDALSMNDIDPQNDTIIDDLVEWLENGWVWLDMDA